MKGNSIITIDVDINIDDKLMTLPTYYYEPKDSFLLIKFKKVEENNEKNNNKSN